MTDFDHLRQSLVRAMPCPPEEVDLTFRRMFGLFGVYARGRFFAIVSPAGLALKLPAAKHPPLIAAGGRPLRFAPDGPTMREYMVVPPALLEDPARLTRWIEASLDYVLTLPLKPRLRR
ncbi:MAG: TfoX/Sxy family protein [Anaerolineae bacterium]|nr:TfoX/Sxy family protein [Anaerolineae bacterium]